MTPAIQQQNIVMVQLYLSLNVFKRILQTVDPLVNLLLRLKEETQKNFLFNFI